MARGILGQAEAPVVGSAATLYTVPAGTEVSQLELHACETSGNATDLTIWADDAGVGTGNDHMLYNANEVAASATRIFSLREMSTSGGKIYIGADVASRLTCTLYGSERTL